MTGKQLINFIRNNKLEHSKLEFAEKETMDFVLKLEGKSEYVDLTYSIGDLYLGHRERRIKKDINIRYIDLGYLVYNEVTRNYEKDWEDITEDEAKKIIENYGISHSNDHGKYLIKYIEDNHLYSHEVVVEKIEDEFRIHFAKRLVIEEDLTFALVRDSVNPDYHVFDKDDNKINNIKGYHTLSQLFTIDNN